MDLSLNDALTRLDKGALHRIEHARGKGVAVFNGSVWVTQDGDHDDHFLEEGQTMVFDRRGLVIVQALSNSRVMVFDAEVEALDDDA
jgi:hypothetical protein